MGTNGNSTRCLLQECIFWDLIRCAASLLLARGGGGRKRKKWECFQAFGVPRGREEGWIMYLHGRWEWAGGNKGGLFSLSLLAGRLLLPLALQYVCGWVGVVIMLGRGDAGVILKEIHNRNCGVGASLWTAEEGWRGSPCWSDSLGPVEALANFGWAADVGEVAGGRVAAHNNNRCFPSLSCPENNRRWALLHWQGAGWPKLQGIQEQCALESFSAPFSSFHLLPICIELKEKKNKTALHIPLFVGTAMQPTCVD